MCELSQSIDIKTSPFFPLDKQYSKPFFKDNPNPKFFLLIKILILIFLFLLIDLIFLITFKELSVEPSSTINIIILNFFFYKIKKNHLKVFLSLIPH